jgi:hypothetical protein
MMTPSHDFGEYRGGKFLTTDVALVIAVGEPCRDFSQVITSDWLTTKRTERLRARRPAIHQDKFHLPPPYAPFFSRLLLPVGSHGSGENTPPNVLRALGIALRGLRSLARRCVDPLARCCPTHQPRTKKMKAFGDGALSKNQIPKKGVGGGMRAPRRWIVVRWRKAVRIHPLT